MYFTRIIYNVEGDNIIIDKMEFLNNAEHNKIQNVADFIVVEIQLN
jgi:hypothetical protein